MSDSRYRQYLALFLTGALLYLAAVLPFLVYHGGIFFYYGDYNVQQVPFYILGGRIVRSGHLYWTTSIDLGTSWLGSFAMYLSGSPFFYLSVLLPESVVPYAMPFLMSLKYGTALTTSYAYAQTLIPAMSQPADHPVTRRSHWSLSALAAALLYTFSGWSQTNIVFQHFHEAYAFWPLYLLLFDRYVLLMRQARQNGTAVTLQDSTALSCSPGSHEGLPNRARRAGIAFSLMTAFTAILNYYFFYGEVLFLILYYLLRYGTSSPSLRQTLREICSLLLYGLLGVCLSAFYLIQVYDMVSGNTRLADTISGLDMIVYKGHSTPLAILRSLFSLPDLVGRGTLYTNDEITNSAPALYLPLLSVSGVIAYFLARSLREDWMKRLLTACAVIAFVPVLNSAFNMFNAEYYARWYYMPLLFMAIATAVMLTENDIPRLRTGAWISIAAFVILSLGVLLPSRDEDGNLVFGQTIEYPEIYHIQLCVSAVLLAALLVLVCILPRVRRQAPGMLLSRRLVIIIAIASLLSTITTLYCGNTIIARSGGVKWRQQMLDNTPEIPETDNANAAMQTTTREAPGDGSPQHPEDAWYRIETDGSSTNYELVWGLPTIHSFQSTVPGGLFDFYHGIGYNRTVNTKLSLTRIGARALTSVRYYLENAIVKTNGSYTESGGMAGYTRIGESDGYNIYEQQHFIPMGFTFDHFITEDRFSLIEESDTITADRLLVRDLILSSEDALAYGHLFESEDTELPQEPADDARFLSDCNERAASVCTYFAYTDSGFEAIAENPEEELVFFSIPYDDGFTAAIDGERTRIIRADYGLMAVDVPAGRHEITFSYRPAHLGAGYTVSAAAAIVMICLMIRTGAVPRLNARIPGHNHG